VQVVPAAQALPQAPQFSESLLTSAHAAPQQICEAVVPQ
jgi:hypothetical protein